MRGNDRQPPEDLGSGGVNLFHPLVIGRLRGRSGKRVIDEGLAFLALVIRVETLLEPDRALEAIADIGAAGRAAAVRWMNDHAVVEFSIKFPERVVKLRGQLVGIPAEEIRTAGGIDEERIACEHAPREIRVLLVGRDITDVLGRVARRMTSGQNERAELEFIAILDRLNGKTVFRAAFPARVNLRRPGAIRQFAGAADEIGMDMRFEDVGDGDAVFSGQLQIDFHVGPRIDDGGRAFLIIADQVRDRGDAISENAFEDKRHRIR